MIRQEGRVLLAGARPPAVLGQVDLHAAVAQLAQAAAVDLGVRVAEGDHRATHSGGHQRVRAGRRLAVVAARLEGEVERLASGALAGPGERHGLGVRLSGRQVPPWRRILRRAPGRRPPAGWDAYCRGPARPGRTPRPYTVRRPCNNAPEHALQGGRRRGAVPASLIRTMTVGPGISPGRPLSGFAGCTAGGDFHPALKQRLVLQSRIIRPRRQPAPLPRNAPRCRGRRNA